MLARDNCDLRTAEKLNFWKAVKLRVYPPPENVQFITFILTICAVFIPNGDKRLKQTIVLSTTAHFPEN